MAYLAQIVRATKLNVWECSACRIPVALTVDHEEQLRTHGGEFYCPAGHVQSWHGNTEVDRLRVKLAEQTRAATQMAERALLAQESQRTAEAMQERAASELRKVKARAKAGLCPCCNRSFVALGRHMQTKHPNFKP